MNKYRTLTKEELQLFEKEFIEYLAVNGIDAPYWQKIKEQEPEKAEKLIDVFADVIFNSVLMKVQYIEHIGSNSMKFFKYNEKEAILIGLDGDVDFSNHQELLKAIGDSSKKLKIYSLKKSYTKPREEEIFDMLKTGCGISEGKMFESLKPIVLI